MNEGKEGSSLRLSKLISEYARSHPRLPSSVQTAGRVRETLLKARKGTKGKRAGLHDDMVESDKDGDRPRSEDQPK